MEILNKNCEDIILSSNNEVKSRSLVHLLYMGIVVCVAAVCAVTGDVFMSLLSAVVGGGFFAAACLCRFNIFTVTPMVIVPLVVVGAITENFSLTIMSLSFLPVGFAVFYCICKNKNRSQTVLTSTVALTLFYAALYSVIIVSIFGYINGGAVEKYIELNLDVVRESMEEAREVYENSDLKDQLQSEEVFTEGFEEKVIQSIRTSFAGYMIMLFAISSFVATVIAKRISQKNGSFPAECGEWKFIFSKPGAVVFLLAYFIGSMYVSEKEGPYLPFAINTLCMCLYPAILYMGIRKLASMFKGRGGGTIVMLIVSLVLFGSFIMPLIIIVGVFATLLYKENNTEKT